MISSSFLYSLHFLGLPWCNFSCSKSNSFLYIHDPPLHAETLHISRNIPLYLNNSHVRTEGNFLHITGVSFILLMWNLSLSKYIWVSISSLLAFISIIGSPFIFPSSFSQVLLPVSPTLDTLLLSLLLCSSWVPSFWLSTSFCWTFYEVLLFQMNSCEFFV